MNNLLNSYFVKTHRLEISITIIAIVLFLIGVSNFSDQTDLFDPFNEPSQYYFTSTFLIMFFLWKTNYFTRNN